MSVKKSEVASKVLADVIVKGMQEKKAKNIVLLDLREVNNAVADFFVICSVNSDTQMSSVRDSVEEQAYLMGGNNPWHREGTDGKPQWAIVDYVDVVAHIFTPEKRQFYGLEELWGDAKVTRFEDVL